MLVLITFLPWTWREALEIEIPDDTEELRAAVEIAVGMNARLDCANLAGARLDGANLAGARLDGANLASARLAGANLDGANLHGADLASARLADANLDGANLAGARLDGANLASARLAGANLDGANLHGANLAGADLASANLAGANLAGANLDSANLAGARLVNIRNDLWDVLLRAQPEVPALLAALREGRIDGSTYTGPCACLAGTIANARGVSHHKLGFTNPYRLIERWFLGISKGSTPATNQIARITEGWIVEFQRLVGQDAS